MTESAPGPPPCPRPADCERPRVTILVGDLSRQGAGRWGGGVRPFLLGQALQQVGYPVEIVGLACGPATDLDDIPLPVRVVPLKVPQFTPNAVRTLLPHLQGDVIYACKPKPSSFGLALLHRWYSRKPVILDIDDWELSWHGGDQYRYRPSVRQLARDLLKPDGALRQPDHPVYLQGMERLIPHADGITTHSSFLQHRFGGVYVPNGKDIYLFDPARYDPDRGRQQYGLSAYRVLMFPGAPRPYKGVEDLLTALDLLDADDLKLVIVGGSPYDDYDQYLLNRWPHRIVHLGPQPQAAMPQLVAAAHVIVVPQRQTPAAEAQFPLKLTDGMAMAKPVLATRVGDLPTILGETGYLVAPDAPAQLAAGVQAIFADYDRALALGKAARVRCMGHYSIEAMGNGLHQLLLSLNGTLPLER